MTAAPRTPRTVFTGANLLDGLRAARPATVVVEGERIAAVLDAGVPVLAADGGRDGDRDRDGDRVVDLAGRTLMPGMVSCHFHATYHELGSRPAPFGLEEAPALQAVRAVRNLERVLECGFTSAVSAGAPHAIDPAMRTAIAQGAVRGPRFVPGSRDVSTTGHVNDSSPWYWEVRSRGALHLCDGPDDFRRAVREEIREGARIIKMFVTGGHGTVGPAERTEMTPEEMRAGIEAAHARGAMVRGHIANREALAMALDCGIDVVDHGDGLDDALIGRLVETATPLVPSLFFPFRLWSALSALASAQGGGDGGGFGFGDSLRADIDAALEILPRANEAGVTLVIGDDYGAMGFPHGIYGEELSFYVDEVGIAPLDVLRWATANGAALMGRADDLGSVEAGKLADLLVVEGDPSADISVLSDPTKVLAVVKGGVLMKGEEFMKGVTAGATFGA